MKNLFKIFSKKRKKSLKQLQSETVYNDELIDFKKPLFWMATEKVV